MKEKNTDITIKQVANGFYVMKDASPHEARMNEDVKVFQSFQELTQYLGEHFSWRNNFVQVDV